MMKWIALIGVPVVLTGCACCQTEVVGSTCCRPAAVVGYTKVGVVPVVAPVVVAPVVEPVMVDAGYIEPLDVTTTTIDFY